MENSLSSHYPKKVGLKYSIYYLLPLSYSYTSSYENYLHCTFLVKCFVVVVFYGDSKI